jgi:hypothetical protein
MPEFMPILILWWVFLLVLVNVYVLFNFVTWAVFFYIYSETSIYRSRIIRFPVSVIQYLWSLSESYLNYGSRIYCFSGSIVSSSDPRRKWWIEVSLYMM